MKPSKELCAWVAKWCSEHYPIGYERRCKLLHEPCSHFGRPDCPALIQLQEILGKEQRSIAREALGAVRAKADRVYHSTDDRRDSEDCATNVLAEIERQLSKLQTTGERSVPPTEAPR